MDIVTDRGVLICTFVISAWMVSLCFILVLSLFLFYRQSIVAGVIVSVILFSVAYLVWFQLISL